MTDPRLIMFDGARPVLDDYAGLSPGLVSLWEPVA